jgi:predicted acylesterase/phospholipase RssA
MPNKTALVLSGGGMFGSYQAGVWDELEDVIQPDIIVGTSIGSLNGWLIAGGHSGDSLQRQWLELESASQVQWQFPRNFTEGVINPASAEAWIRRVYESCSPTVRYAVVATRMATMKRVRFEWPALSWQHLAASCAVPLFLRQQRINGALYGDGGLSNPLALWDAAEMGATRIVAVNVLKHRPTLLRAGAAVVKLYSGDRDTPDRNVEVVEICPTEPLGRARDTVYWNRANAVRWIDQGRRDARLAKQLVVECLERL